MDARAWGCGGALEVRKSWGLLAARQWTAPKRQADRGRSPRQLHDAGEQALPSQSGNTNGLNADEFRFSLDNCGVLPHLPHERHSRFRPVPRIRQASATPCSGLLRAVRVIIDFAPRDSGHPALRTDCQPPRRSPCLPHTRDPLADLVAEDVGGGR